MKGHLEENNYALVQKRRFQGAETNIAVLSMRDTITTSKLHRYFPRFLRTAANLPTAQLASLTFSVLGEECNKPQLTMEFRRHAASWASKPARATYKLSTPWKTSKSNTFKYQYYIAYHPSKREGTLSQQSCHKCLHSFVSR